MRKRLNFRRKIVEGMTFMLFCTLSLGKIASADSNDQSDLIYPDVSVIYSQDGKEVTIPDGTTTIKKYLFMWNSKIEKVTIPDSVTTIDDGAFYGCTNLKEVIGAANVVNIGEQAFVECRSLERYPFRNSLRTIGLRAFNSCEKLTSITLPEGLTKIGSSAFEDCSSIKKVVIPNSIKVIEHNTFYQCKSLESVILPSNLTEIKEYAFHGSNKIKVVSIPDSVKVVGRGAFSKVKYLIAKKNSGGATYAKEYNIPFKYTNSTGLHKTKVTLLAGEKDTLYFHSASSGTVKWSTSNKKIATVSGGKITAKKAGKVTITAVQKGKKYTCVVTVLKKTVTNRFKQVETNYELTNATDYEKVWAVNHWLAYNVDYTLSAFGAEQALLKGKAKCDGYAWAFYEFMRYFKIQVDYVTSDKWNHAWNLVQIGTKWYHIDTTHNVDYSIYECFLETDAVRKKHDFPADYQIAKCNSTKVDKKYKAPRLNKTAVTLKKGKTVKVKMLNYNKKVKWGSNNPKIATIDKNGKIKAVRKGKTSIYTQIDGRDMVYTTDIVVK